MAGLIEASLGDGGEAAFPPCSSIGRGELIRDLLLSQDYLRRHSFPQVPEPPAGSDAACGRGSAPATVLGTAAWHRRGLEAEPATWALYGIDCEMCLTEGGMEVVWIGLVDEAENAVLDLVCRPEHAVVDAHTRFHGLTPADLRKGMPFEEARQQLLHELPVNAVLVGSVLQGDMTALRVAHPYYLDTAVLFPREPVAPCGKSEVLPDLGVAGGGAVGLQRLALHQLGQLVQVRTHSPVEDALASLRLAKRKLEWLETLRVRFDSPPYSPDEVSLRALLGRLELRPELVLNVYIWGSRLYRCAEPSSDYDTICVVDVPERLHVYEILEDPGGLFNALVIDARSFQMDLAQHRIHLLMLLSSPPEFVLRSRRDFARDLELWKPQLRVATLYEASITLNKGRRQYLTKGEKKGKKRIVAAIRYLQFGIQLAKHGRITDWECANAYLEQALDRMGETLEQSLRYLQPLYDEKSKELQEVCGTPPLVYGACSASAAKSRSKVQSQLAEHAPERLQLRGLPRAAGALLQAQGFVRARGLAALTTELGVLVRCRQFGNSVRLHLMYTAISPAADPVVQECRGLVLDKETLEVVAMPPARFFHAGEPEAARVDWSSAAATAAHDGLQACLYPDGGAWEVASLASADGSEELAWKAEVRITFKELFWEIWNARGYRLPPASAGNRHCYVFEMVTPRHAITNAPREETLVLVAARDLESLQERGLDELAEMAAHYGWLSAARIACGANLAEAEEIAGRLESPLEGLVVADGQCRRVKVKRPWQTLIAAGLTEFGDSPRPCLRKLGPGADGDRISPATAARLRLWDAMRSGKAGELRATWPSLAVGLDGLASDLHFAVTAIREKALELLAVAQAAIGEEIPGTACQVVATFVPPQARKHFATLVTNWVGRGHKSAMTELFRCFDIATRYGRAGISLPMVWLSLVRLEAKEFLELLEWLRSASDPLPAVADGRSLGDEPKAKGILRGGETALSNDELGLAIQAYCQHCSRKAALLATAGSGGARLEVVRFLRGGKSLESLAKPPYAVRSKRHAVHQNLVCLHYSHKASSSKERIVQECRGLILDEADGWRPVCCPYFRFDNFDATKHEISEEEWTGARVYKKVDGTLINVYYYAGRWQVGTSSTADGSSGVAPLFCYEFTGIYSEFFWQTWRQLGYQLPADRELCYMFELQSPQNQVVVPVERPSITLHGARVLSSLEEVDPGPLAAAHGWAAVEQVPFASLQAVLEAAQHLPLHEEGFVIVLPGFRRFKVKSPRYVLASLLPRASQDVAAAGARPQLLRVVLQGEAAEFAAAFPHLREPLAALEAQLDGLVSRLEALLLSVLEGAGPSTDDDLMRKVARALEERAAKKRESGLVFSVIRQSALSMREAIGSLEVDAVEDLLCS